MKNKQKSSSIWLKILIALIIIGVAGIAVLGSQSEYFQGFLGRRTAGPQLSETPRAIQPIRATRDASQKRIDRSKKVVFPSVTIDVNQGQNDKLVFRNHQNVEFGVFDITSNVDVELLELVLTCNPGSTVISGSCDDYLNTLMLWDQSSNIILGGPENIINGRAAFTDTISLTAGNTVSIAVIGNISSTPAYDDTFVLDILTNDVSVSGNASVNLCPGGAIAGCTYEDGETPEIRILPPGTVTVEVTTSLPDKTVAVNEQDTELVTFDITANADHHLFRKLTLKCNEGPLSLSLPCDDVLSSLFLWDVSQNQVIMGPENILFGEVKFDGFSLPLVEGNIQQYKVTGNISSAAQQGESFSLDLEDDNDIQVAHIISGEDVPSDLCIVQFPGCTAANDEVPVIFIEGILGGL